MKTKRMIALLLAGLCLSFAGCEKADDVKTDGTAAKTEAVTGDAEGADTMASMVEKVKSYYSEDTVFVTKAEDDKDENVEFMFTYFFEDEKYLAAVEDYVLSVGDGVDSFACITFKDGTDKTMIDEAKAILKDVYAEGLKSTFAPYDPVASKAAGEGETKVDGNTVILVISVENKEAIKNAIGW